MVLERIFLATHDLDRTPKGVRGLIGLLILLMAGGRARRNASEEARLQGAGGRGRAREIGALRANPKAYAAHLKALRRRYSGRSCCGSTGATPSATKEGKKTARGGDQAAGAREAAGRADVGGRAGARRRRSRARHRQARRRRSLRRRRRVTGRPGGAPRRAGRGAAARTSRWRSAEARLVVVYLLNRRRHRRPRSPRGAARRARYDQVGVACGPHQVVSPRLRHGLRDRLQLARPLTGR